MSLQEKARAFLVFNQDSKHAFERIMLKNALCKMFGIDPVECVRRIEELAQ